MPELPDVTIYIDAIRERVIGETLASIQIASPFLLRTVSPAVDETFDQQVVEIKRLGKRIAIGLENDIWIVIHLMIAGRFQWKAVDARIPGKVGLAAFRFSSGTLLLTEASKKKRASLHIVTRDGLNDHDPGGLDLLSMSLDEFTQSLTLTNRTLKRQLTNPMLFSGIGNAYSDEILHRAKVSPIKQTQKLSEAEVEQIFHATVETMQEWIERLRTETGENFPKKVTAFRKEMAVHGKYKEPCPECGSPVQRIRYAETETNYCATCQNNGTVLADRSLSRLLKNDWPRRIEDWE